MSEGPRLPGPVVWTVAGATVTGVGVLMLPVWLGDAAAAVVRDVPVMSAAIVCLYGQSSLAGRPDATRLKVAVLMPFVLAVVAGTLAYALYAAERPTLLETAYARRLAGATAAQAIAMQRDVARWLNPAAQALDVAQTVMVVGFVVSGFVAFRTRVARYRALRRPAG